MQHRKYFTEKNMYSSKHNFLDVHYAVLLTFNCKRYNAKKNNSLTMTRDMYAYMYP